MRSSFGAGVTEAYWDRAVGARERVESAQGFRKFFKAKEYEEVARHLFIIVEVSLYREHRA